MTRERQPAVRPSLDQRAIALAELAEDPEASIDLPEGSRRTVTDRFCVVVGPQRQWASVCRLRLPGRLQDVARCIADVRERVSDIPQVTWSVGSSSTPVDLPERLRASGLRDPDPPFDPICSALILTEQPPAAEGVRVRRIRTFDEHVLGLEIMLAAASWSEQAAAEARATAEETFGRRTRRGGFQWLAFVEGEAAAWAMAEAAPAGLFLSGGATLPDARGRGCYRALVRARWDESVGLGRSGLAVQAQHGSSAPILRRLGFTQVATVHTLQP